MWEYHITDHLGNTRVRFEDVNGDGIATSDEIISEEQYYPFGLSADGIWKDNHPPLHADRSNYNGKELTLDMDLGLLDYGARYYNPKISQFMSVDPLADERSWLAPYNYVQNNPIMRINPTGMIDTLAPGGLYTELQTTSQDSLQILNHDRPVALPSSAGQSGFTWYNRHKSGVLEGAKGDGSQTVIESPFGGFDNKGQGINSWAARFGTYLFDQSKVNWEGRFNQGNYNVYIFEGRVITTEISNEGDTMWQIIITPSTGQIDTTDGYAGRRPKGKLELLRKGGNLSKFK